MKTYLFNFEMFTRKLTGKHQIPYATLLHLIKNNLIGEFQSVVRDAERTASGDINKLLSELRTAAGRSER